MTKTLSYLVTAVFLIIHSGCKFPNENKVTSDQIPPVIKGATTSLNVINIGVLSIPADKSTVDTTLTVYVSTADDNGLSDISSVSYSIVTPSGDILTHGTLSDDGITPDVTANDGKYTSTISIKFPKEILGTYQIQLQTVDNTGLASIVRSFPIKIFNSANVAPIIANLTLPDTILVPSAGSVNFVQVSISASDQDGLRDIVSVSLTLIRPKDPTTDSSVVGIYPLYDDGGKISVSPFGITSGDITAGDGSYSLIIPVPSDTKSGIIRYFSLSAKDQSNATSNIIVKKVYFK